MVLEARKFSLAFESLASNAIHLWLCPYQDTRLDEVLPRLREQLCVEELARERKFRFPDDLRRFVATRALLRTCLSRYVDLRPADWRFELNAFGKPSVTHDDLTVRRLRFNISHTRGLIVLAIGLDHGMGVDVECPDRAVSPLSLANRYFTPREVDDLSHLQAQAQLKRFFEYWTLKEAYIKARGDGLSVPLDRFGFRFDGESAMRLDIDPRLGDDGRYWSLWQWELITAHLIALCVRSDVDCCPPRIDSTWILPLVSESRLDLTPLRSTFARPAAADT
jgi:4'-phosphopantetheinyl transferase